MSDLPDGLHSYEPHEAFQVQAEAEIRRAFGFLEWVRDEQDPAEIIQCIAEDPSVLLYVGTVLRRVAEMQTAIDDALTVFTDTRWWLSYHGLGSGYGEG